MVCDSNIINIWLVLIMIIDRKESVMEDHVILSGRLEGQLKAVEWVKTEQKRLLKEKGERISKDLWRR